MPIVSRVPLHVWSGGAFLPERAFWLVVRGKLPIDTSQQGDPQLSIFNTHINYRWLSCMLYWVISTQTLLINQWCMWKIPASPSATSESGIGSWKHHFETLNSSWLAEYARIDVRWDTRCLGGKFTPGAKFCSSIGVSVCDVSKYGVKELEIIYGNIILTG